MKGFRILSVAYGYSYSGNQAEFNIPISATANCHFYQLIADKVSKGSKMHADKLHVYAGASLGTGSALHPNGYDDNGNKTTTTDVLIVAGIQAGVRYYFTPKIAVNGELGWGKTFATAGITFNL